MKAVWRWLVLVLLALLALQVFMVLRVASMAIVDPSSTSFERSQIWQVLQRRGQIAWRQTWVDEGQISSTLKRAVIASEDDIFARHGGIRWDAIEQAWDRNSKAQERAQRQAARKPGANVPVKMVGGSTITQQLAKNLLLSGERNMVRKAQEALLTLTLEAVMDKRRLLTLYLNHVEWGEGVFGAEAAAQHYFRKPARALSAWEAARLAVMLPRPRYFEQRPQSAYLAERADVIVQRMGGVELPK
ncbi:MAG: hypothetical protein RIQ38_2202 [Pseudomonadota bacterium]